MNHLQCAKCGHRFHDEQSKETHTLPFPGEPDEVFYSREGKADHDTPQDEVMRCPVCGMIQKTHTTIDENSAGTMTKHTMHFQNNALPAGAVFAGKTPELNEKNIPVPMLNRHLAPVGKCGYLVVTSGHLRFVWEKNGEILDAMPGHPIVIFPERYHHIHLTGPVQFHVEFYRFPQNVHIPSREGIRPGEDFIDQ